MGLKNAYENNIEGSFSASVTFMYKSESFGNLPYNFSSDPVFCKIKQRKVEYLAVLVDLRMNSRADSRSYRRTE